MLIDVNLWAEMGHLEDSMVNERLKNMNAKSDKITLEYF